MDAGGASDSGTAVGAAEEKELQTILFDDSVLESLAETAW
jgi:hypothetical protein